MNKMQNFLLIKFNIMFSPYCIKENILKIIYDKLFMIKRRIKCHRVIKSSYYKSRQNTPLINLQNNITFHWSMTKNLLIFIEFPFILSK